MRKIIEQGVVTLDGQISTPQDWLPTRWEGEMEQYSRDLLFSVDALLYGRISYEAHAEVWPTLEGAFGDYAVRMNTIPKHVASRTLTEVTWNATLLGDDVVGAVRELKEQAGRRHPQDRHRWFVQPDAAGAPAGRRVPLLAVPGRRGQRRPALRRASTPRTSTWSTSSGSTTASSVSPTLPAPADQVLVRMTSCWVARVIAT